ncbi:MAG: succinate dehydrogenase, cytochrome b556 subunit [Candidatus Marinimicrobia bacterium]|nr:succinate dehydrogenase, cytochrome b556 subunit [Candidatus Neomarinimicrobiota bacterium]MCF7828004.1 succinate dehydrogenase, cytochrome b556 subunit [Candidatus Neomarinimicrobiota bacterium]MCF7879241.1 succinate dehydrogenase, cytochrome b556 subunit [Candidatus Neomarinimicrobiota bacterium]
MKLNSLTELKLNWNWGMVSFVLHRITGVALTIYVFLHIWTLSAVQDGEAAFNHSLDKWDNLVGHIFEYLLLLAVAYHLFNGIRVTFVDIMRFTRQQKRMLAWVVILTAIVAIISLSIFIPEITKPV